MFTQLKIIVVRGIQIGFGLFLFGLSMFGTGALLGFVRPPVEVREVVKTVEVPEPDFTFADALVMADEMEVPPVVAIVLLNHEGGGRFSGDSKRCEFQSSWWLKKATEQAAKLVKAGKILKWESEAQRDAMRCSYGPGQVAGWWAPEFGMVWADLTGLKENVWMAFSIWKRAEAQAIKENPKADRWTILRVAFRIYNGSGPSAEAYADGRMGELTKLIFDKAAGAGWLG